MIENSATGATGKLVIGITIQGGSWDGNTGIGRNDVFHFEVGAAAGYGFDTRGLTMEDVTVRHAANYGFYYYVYPGNYSSIYLDRVQSRDSTSTGHVGYYLYGVADSYFTNLYEGDAINAFYLASCFFTTIYTRELVFFGCNECTFNNILSDNADGHGLWLKACKYNRFNNIYVRQVGNNGTYSGIKVDNDGLGYGWYSQFNQFMNVYVKGQASYKWLYGLEETDTDENYNVYIGIYTYENCITGIRIMSTQSMCHSSYNGTSWVT
jgi:hypothetical protein